MTSRNGSIVSAIARQLTGWLRESGPEGDVVISSRARLARNLSRFPLLTVADQKMCQEIHDYLSDKIQKAQFQKKLYYLSLGGLDPLDRSVLVERHLISRDLANSALPRGVAITEDESVSIMINEEDHLRLQAIFPGMQTNRAYDEINQLDSLLESDLNYSFHPKYGYVTCCPTNLGTGLRVSVLLHLPATVMTKQLEKVLQAFYRMRYSVRGLYGEGTAPAGHFFQMANQVSLGRSESDTVAELNQAIPEILKFERDLRDRLFAAEKNKVEDSIYRALGVLKNARTISTDETLEHLSALRLGVSMKIISVPFATLNEIFLFCQPSHIQKMNDRILETEQRDAFRAEFVRQKLASASL